MSDKELIKELRKMLKLSQEDREFLESCYEGTYAYNGGNFDDTFEACVKMGAIDTKVSVSADPVEIKVTMPFLPERNVCVEIGLLSPRPIMLDEKSKDLLEAPGSTITFTTLMFVELPRFVVVKEMLPVKVMNWYGEPFMSMTCEALYVGAVAGECACCSRYSCEELTVELFTPTLASSASTMSFRSLCWTS